MFLVVGGNSVRKWNFYYFGQFSSGHHQVASCGSSQSVVEHFVSLRIICSNFIIL